VPVQLGGGIRDMDTIDHWLGAGVQRVILGTAAIKNPDLVRAACDKYPGRIVVGIDARGGRVAVEGWAETSDTRALDLAMRFENDGVAAIVYTDIDRDGAMQGVNIDATVDLAFALTTPVIASGGVRGISDIADLKAHESAGIEGVISGRAIYDGRLNAAEALALLKG
jgi:phosphoribosylformimino-5-aminoimidazole carboxamide ribotide isomerase